MSLIQFSNKVAAQESVDVGMQLMTLKKMFCEQKRDGKIVTGRRKKQIEDDKAIDEMVFSDDSQSSDGLQVVIPKSKSGVEEVDI